MASSIGWVDYDQGDADRARQLVSLFSSAEARDELGLGAIRDAFSNLLFPGTSTIQTRLRYFILLPRLMAEIEPRLARANDREGILRRREADLIRELSSADDKLGLIGAEAGEAVKRMPSAVYWQGLGAWGIRTNANDGIGATLDRMSAGTACWTDIPGEGDLGGFVLAAHERCFLVEQVAGVAPAGSLTVLGWLFLNAEIVVGAMGGRAALGAAWLPDVLRVLEEAGAPQLLASELRCAVQFSGVMHGAALLYNEMLARHAGENGLVEEYAGQLEAWRSTLQRKPLDPGQLLAPLARVAGSRPFNPLTLEFVRLWFSLAWRSPTGAEARALLAAREDRTKGPRARLSKPLDGSTWSGASGAGELVYRWPTVRQYMLDLTGPFA